MIKILNIDARPAETSHSKSRKRQPHVEQQNKYA